MVSVNSFSDLENQLQLNEQKIKLLQDANVALNDRYQIKSKYSALQNELKTFEVLEAERKLKHDKDRRKELIEMEHVGRDLCQEHSKVMHQIEHIGWHLNSAHPHEVTTPIEFPQLPSKVCHADGLGHGANHSHSHSHGHAHALKHHCTNKTGANMGYLQISAERLIKVVSDLRHRICLTRQNLEQESERKRAAEKNLAELRKQISKQKRLMSTKRCVPLPVITTVRKCVK